MCGLCACHGLLICWLFLQAACRADLYSGKAPADRGSVPVSQEGQLNALRSVFRTANEEERERRYQASLTQETD